LSQRRIVAAETPSSLAACWMVTVAPSGSGGAAAGMSYIRMLWMGLRKKAAYLPG